MVFFGHGEKDTALTNQPSNKSTIQPFILMFDFSDKSFLITGVGGFIASHIAEHLLRGGARRVVGIDSMATGFQENVDLLRTYPHFEFIHGDLTDLATCHRACAGVDLICHQAAIGSVPRSVKTPDVTTASNIQGFVNLVVAARDAGIRRMVFASSSSVYGDEPNLPKIEHRIGQPLSPYAITKYTNEIMAWNFAALYDMEFVGFRYFNVFGPRQSPKGVYAAVIPLFIDACFKNEPSYLNGDGLQTRDFTYVDNVVQANLRAMLTDRAEALNQVYNIGLGGRYTLLDLYSTIAELTGCSRPPEHRAERAGDIRDSQADVSKAKNLLGYAPEVDFREGLRRTVEWFRSQSAGN
jgi:UDP-N-acetylglucosamine/UDP-N-acetylgalactosamine 4-epimerase